jgi:hypothetical protein
MRYVVLFLLLLSSVSFADPQLPLTISISGTGQPHSDATLVQQFDGYYIGAADTPLVWEVVKTPDGSWDVAYDSRYVLEEFYGMQVHGEWTFYGDPGAFTSFAMTDSYHGLPDTSTGLSDAVDFGGQTWNPNQLSGTFTPEPASLGILGAGALLLLRRKR